MTIMKKIRFARSLAALLGLLVAATAHAQVFTPTYTSPRLVNEVGFYLSDGPGDLGLEGIWRGGPLGLRVGFMDSGDGLLSLGGELRNPLPMAGAPLGLAFTLGAQGLLGDRSALGIQGGVSAGYTFRGDGMAFTPYLHPRIGLLDELGPGEELSIKPLADLGLDVEFYTNLLIHLGVKLDNVGSSWGLGLAWRR